jgi:hypothetical protein
MATKFKRYHIHTSYRGRYFDLTMFGTSQKQIVQRLQDLGIYITLSYLNKHSSNAPLKETDTDMDKITIEPYGSNSVEILGRELLSLQEAIQLIDKECEKWQANIKAGIYPSIK